MPDGGLDTPTLLGLWSTAPYLHDGSAPTLQDAVLAHTLGPIGATVAGLTAGQLDDLAAFLEQIESGTQVTDGDSDGVIDMLDNCSAHANSNQRDTNGDGYGNACDGDLDDDCIVNATDLGLFKTVFFTPDADADFNGDGIVNAIDLGILRTLYFEAPGPSGLTGVCDAT